MPRAPRLSRRSVLQSTALLSAGVWLGSAGRTRAAGPNEKLNVAVIGLGGQGRSNLGGVSGENVVALCDLDATRAGDAFTKFASAKRYADFRKMYDEMEKQIDGVVISTPDHTHFNPAYRAMQMGKHVYLEKPMAHSVWEVRELTKLAAEKKVATQLGVQRHTLDSVRRSVELIQKGAIGKVSEVHAWVGGNRGLPGPAKTGETVPADLDWDLWLGPAAERPYSSDYVPYKWRFWWDFGTGETGNWGCHILDIPFWALGLKYPTKVEASGPAVHADQTPKSMASKFEFAGPSGPVALHWYHGTPPVLAEKGLNGKNANNLFIGSEGMLLCGFNSYQLLPEAQFKDYKEPEKFLPKSPGFHKEWIQAAKGGAPASCDFSYSGPMTETVLLGNVAYRAGEAFTWDAATLKTSSAKAEGLLKSHFRKGWEVS